MRNIDLREAYESMYISESVETEEVIQEEEGKKDACYDKVKASAKVWPSAYASGRLVQCRKKGASNYGNKKEELEMALSFILNEGFASNEDDALAILESMSDEWYDSIMEDLHEGLEKFKKAQAERRANRMNPDEEEVKVKPEPKKPEYNAAPGETKKLKQRGMRKGEGLGVGARKRQGAGKPDEQAKGGPVRFQ